MCAKFNSVVVVVVVATLVYGAAAIPSQDNVERDFINMINRIDGEKSVSLFGGLHIERVANAGRSFGAVRAIESFDERAERYLETHQLSLSLPSESEEDDTADEEFAGRGLEESRSKKMKKMLVPLLLALKLKKAVIVKVLFTIIKFISLKSLAISILALILAGAQFFKDMMGKKKEHITTAYITGAPQAEIVHSDWNRNGQAAAADLAYNHYGLAQPF